MQEDREMKVINDDEPTFWVSNKFKQKDVDVVGCSEPKTLTCLSDRSLTCKRMTTS